MPNFGFQNRYYYVVDNFFYFKSIKTEIIEFIRLDKKNIQKSRTEDELKFQNNVRGHGFS